MRRSSHEPGVGSTMNVVAWAVTAVAVYGAVVGGMYLGQRRLMYFPSETTPSPAQWSVPEMTPVRLRTEDGLDLLAWYKPAAPGRPTLVFFCGNAGHLGYRGGKLRAFLDQGYGALLPAYRGYSGNGGEPHEAGLYADGRAALAFLDGEAVGADRLVLYGESLGSGVAVKLAVEAAEAGTPVAAVVLEAPFTSVPDVAQRRYFFLPARALVLDRFDNASRIGRIAAPLLVFHGERDGVVPVGFGKGLFEAARDPKTLKLYPRAGHNDLYEHGAARDVLAFLDAHLEPGG